MTLSESVGVCRSLSELCGLPPSSVTVHDCRGLSVCRGYVGMSVCRYVGMGPRYVECMSSVCQVYVDDLSGRQASWGSITPV